ncbi:MAG TPA: T9SS type A sorting domain-containing protein [Flavobacteriales bacterium]|nr:T9SS type A sorting domain-containing protein [Flavobacteriales bacterium]HIN39611.1 T9SS type A sorting domain-containing protein [Flavobacteriales bacterium]
MKVQAIISCFILLWTLESNHLQGQYSKVIYEPEIALKKKVICQAQKSERQVIVLSGEAMHDAAIHWNKSVKHLGIKHELPKELIKLKSEKTKAKLQHFKQGYPKNQEHGSNGTVTPLVGTNFAGNWYDGGYPPDNSLAISNGGYIVSVVNSNIEYYNTSGTLLYTASFYDFFNDVSLTATLYDPVVLYDSGADKFFMVVLHGSSSTTSKVVLCFSKTNNPSDGWWFYQLTGNPLNDNCWFDYPKIGVSNNEVYVTGNLFKNSSNTAEQSVVYQIQKASGYSGGSLIWQFWHSISENPFALVPASYGQQGNYGPGIYLISTFENGAADKLFLYDLNDDMSGSPAMDAYSINADFSLGGNAFQAGSSVELNVGDNRGLSAFYLNGILHFVFHSEYMNNYNGINYNRINVSALTNNSKLFGLDGYDYVYPNLASFSSSISDQSVMIGFLRSNASIYPEFRVVSCDDNMNWSTSTSVKAGITYADNGNVSETRWGDYTGISRKHNSSIEVWVGGQYGTTRDVSGIGISQCFETWVAQILPGTTGFENKMDNNNKNNIVYPNPIYDMFTMEFYLIERADIEINVIDINGKLVKILYKDVAEKGKNLVSFNKAALDKGIYFINIRSGQKIINNEKIILQ